MKPDLYWIPGPWKGRLAVAPRPRGGDWLPDEIESWGNHSIKLVISFLERAETAEFELNSENELATRKGMRFINFPIPDRDVPSSNQEFFRLLDQAHESLVLGENVLIHCRQGIGRSGLLAAALLMMAGETLDQAIKHVSHARGVPIPETTQQLDWLRRLAASIAADRPIRLRA